MPFKDLEKRKAMHALYSAAHYQKNKATIVAATKKNKKAKREEWRAFKATLQCARCGENHPSALDFHHEIPAEKEHSINNLCRVGAYRKIREELKKCIVLCANCHRKHHAPE